MTDPNFTLGRGTLHLNGRSLEHTPVVGIRNVPGGREIYFALQDISEANLAWFLGNRVERGLLEYKANNPQGLNIGFRMYDAEITGDTFDIKSDEWQVLRFVARGVLEIVMPAEVA